MTKFGLFSLLTILAVLCEPLVSVQIGNPALRPDMLLVPVVAAVVAAPGPIAVLSGGLIGLICDCLTGPQPGPQTAALAAHRGHRQPDFPAIEIDRRRFPLVVRLRLSGACGRVGRLPRARPASLRRRGGRRADRGHVVRHGPFADRRFVVDPTGGPAVRASLLGRHGADRHARLVARL